MAISAADSVGSYGWEAVAYGTEAAAFDKVLGYDCRSSISRNNNRIEVQTIGDQDPAAQIAGAFEGSASFDFVCSDFYWLRMVTGAVADAGVNPTTHTYTYTNTPIGVSINRGFNLGTDSNQNLLGFFATDATITGSVGEPVRATINGMYANEAEDATLEANVTPSEDPFTFAHCTFEMPNASVITPITSVAMTFNRNPSRVQTIGTRLTQDRIFGVRNISLAITAPFEAAADFLEDFYGSGTGPSSTSVAEVATAELTITNGEAGADQRSLVVLVSNVFVDQESLAVAPNEMVNEDVTMYARAMTSCVYTNDDAAAP
jgi:hypothetical protein